jgi:hypothetical protein
VAGRLREAAANWRRDVLAAEGPDDRPFPAGHAAATFLPARDGVPEGGVKRSSPHPNCSYFTGWTSTAGSITWDVEIAGAGEYEAFIYYACPAADTGATLELSFLDARVAAKIAEPWDPSLIGGADDRAPRTESFVKDFRPLRLGVIALPRGRGTLTLRALDIPGAQAAEIRYVSLVRR